MAILSFARSVPTARVSEAPFTEAIAGKHAMAIKF
jgi:hypothetical protein